MNATRSPQRPHPVEERSEDGIIRMFPRIMAPAAEVDLRDLLRKISRRKGVLIGTVVLLMALTAIILNQIAPRYTASAQVMIEARQNRVVDIEAVVSGLPQDMETIESEIEILRSRRLAEKVIRALKLYENPEFNPPEKMPPAWHRYLKLSTYIPDSLVGVIAPAEVPRAMTPEERLEQERVQVVDRFLDRLVLDRVGRSRVINIKFSANNAEVAAQVANKIADLYIVDQLEAKFEATKRATEWLSERVAALRKAVTSSENAVEVYRKQSGLIQGKGVTLATQQISELNTQLILARAKRAEAEARLQQVQNLLKSKRGVDSVAEVLASPLIQRLREEESRLIRKAAEMSQEYGDKHPKMINARAELADQRHKIQVEVNKIVENLRNQVQVARAAENELSSNLTRMEGEIAQQNRSEVQLRALEREAKANRDLYDTFLSRFKETNQQQDIQQADARIISRADVPADPSFPRMPLLYGVAFAGSVLIGIVLIMVIEHLDHGFRSTTQIEQSMGVPALGLIPMIGGLDKLRSEPFDYIVERPVSAFGEAVRSLYTSILLSNVDSPPRTVLITSSLPNEGKTSLSISLGRLVALQSQKRVVLIDADLRRPQLHRKMGLPASPGLVEYLAGEATLDEVMRHDEKSGAQVIVAGGIPNNPTDILASDHMKSLLDELTKANDLVVLDSPPALAVSDPRVLSRLAEKTVYVVRWAETRRETALMGLKQIVDVGSDVAGVVLSMVNVRKHSRYGYGDSGTYYGQYRKYYTR
jgi:capsular exopolysaccharide synthesis family protein